MSHCAMVYHIINNTLDTAHQVLLYRISESNTNSPRRFPYKMRLFSSTVIQCALGRLLSNGAILDRRGNFGHLPELRGQSCPIFAKVAPFDGIRFLLTQQPSVKESCYVDFVSDDQLSFTGGSIETTNWRLCKKNWIISLLIRSSV